jgi:hypothetical protein
MFGAMEEEDGNSLFRLGINFSSVFRGDLVENECKKGERRRRCCRAVELFMSLIEWRPEKLVKEEKRDLWVF